MKNLSPHDQLENQTADPTLILFDQDRLAEILGCSPRTLERHRIEGTGIPYLRIGRLVRYRLSEVQAHLAVQRRTSTSVAGSEAIKL